MILIDTSVWIDYFKNGNREIEQLILDKKIATCDIIIMEFLQGLKSDKEYELFKEWFISLPNYKITQNDFLLSSSIYRECRKKGITIRKPIDCLISAISINNNLKLLTKDRDFNNIQKCFKINLFIPKNLS